MRKKIARENFDIVDVFSCTVQTNKHRLINVTIILFSLWEAEERQQYC